MASKLYVGGLAYSTTSEGLREFFAQSGNVLSATVITDRFSGQSRGFGFVEMATAEEAQNAISQLNGRELDGRRITVEVSNPQAPRTGGGRRGPPRGRPFRLVTAIEREGESSPPQREHPLRGDGQRREGRITDTERIAHRIGDGAAETGIAALAQAAQPERICGRAHFLIKRVDGRH